MSSMFGGGSDSFYLMYQGFFFFFFPGAKSVFLDGNKLTITYYYSLETNPDDLSHTDAGKDNWTIRSHVVSASLAAPKPLTNTLQANQPLCLANASEKRANGVFSYCSCTGF